MIELIYVSRSAKRFEDSELKQMLKAFRHNNSNKGVTGLLLYDGLGTFIQLLEGNDKTVRGLYKKILQDDRHSRVNLLSECSIEDRCFPDWKMGFKKLHHQNSERIDGFSHFLCENNKDEFLKKKPNFAIELFYHFKKSISSDKD